ncbi:MAG: tail fiber domain-containing protein [Sedimentisphaerales bacterium]|nr:tail fiber domain-containing protein [Sedimentisphaerales bacterium]
MRTAKILMVLLAALCPAIGAVRAAQTGSLSAWGDNTYGQTDVPAGNHFVAVAGGWSHSLALKGDGSIVAWGDNHWGQCNVPSPNTDFVAIAAGEYHGLGLKSDGSIVAWGANSYGQCNPPVPNAGFVAVAAGRSHSLGLKSGGSIVAWGSNSRGQCNVPSPNAGFVAVSGGEGHSLALKGDGSVAAWGDNSLSQCAVASPNTGFVAVAAGSGHSLGLKSNGSIVAWGDNSAGECNVPSPNASFIATAAGEGVSLGLKGDGSIVAWGSNAYGQCNLPAANIGFAAVAAGLRHALAIKTAPLGGGGTDNYIARWLGTSDLEESAIYQTDAGHIGIGTTSPVCSLDVAGAMNLNKDKTGIALTVNGKEALWSNDSYFSWGSGGSANYFGDNVGIGPGSTNPLERLDLSWSGGVNACIGRYNYLGSCFSSATFVLGNNARARTDSVNGIVVGQPHDSYGYRAVTMGSDGIAFHTLAGKVTPGDPVASERVRITNDGKVGIGTTTPQTIFQVGTGMTTFSTFPLSADKQVHPAPQTGGYGTQGIGFNLYRRDDGTWETPAKSGGVALIGHHYGLNIACVNSAPPSTPTTFTDAQIAESVAMTILADGRVGLGRWPSANLDVDGDVRIRTMRTVSSGVIVGIDANGELQRLGSSRRYKTNIRDLEEDPEKILDLRPVQFQCKTTGQDDVGLIAEEVAESMKDLVIYDNEGRPEAVKYDRVALYLLSVVKAQQQRIAELEAAQAENRSLAQRIEALERMVRQQTAVAKEVRP